MELLNLPETPSRVCPMPDELGGFCTYGKRTMADERRNKKA
jgi:hypothetical protein